LLLYNWGIRIIKKELGESNGWRNLVARAARDCLLMLCEIWLLFANQEQKYTPYVQEGREYFLASMSDGFGGTDRSTWNLRTS
jgi:hypothetical protein